MYNKGRVMWRQGRDYEGHGRRIVYHLISVALDLLTSIRSHKATLMTGKNMHDKILSLFRTHEILLKNNTLDSTIQPYTSIERQ